jgi:hypothetical protein
MYCRAAFSGPWPLCRYSISTSTFAREACGAAPSGCCSPLNVRAGALWAAGSVRDSPYAPRPVQCGWKMWLAHGATRRLSLMLRAVGVYCQVHPLHPHAQLPHDVKLRIRLPCDVLCAPRRSYGWPRAWCTSPRTLARPSPRASRTRCSILVACRVQRRSGT